MDITFTTPALLFPAISLLILAYTNKFLAIANLIRSLHSQFQSNQLKEIHEQIITLKRRVYLIMMMQAFAILSFLSCFLCMFLLFNGNIQLATMVFGASLVLMMISLAICLWEIIISADALRVLLGDFPEELEEK
jgi:uncharacterized membrane protein YqjE